MIFPLSMAIPFGLEQVVKAPVQAKIMELLFFHALYLS
jgi:hypothetical protein